MRISKKKFKALEKRITDLEIRVQGLQLNEQNKFDCGCDTSTVCGSTVTIDADSIRSVVGKSTLKITADYITSQVQ